MQQKPDRKPSQRSSRPSLGGVHDAVQVSDVVYKRLYKVKVTVAPPLLCPLALAFQFVRGNFNFQLVLFFARSLQNG